MHAPHWTHTPDTTYNINIAHHKQEKDIRTSWGWSELWFVYPPFSVLKNLLFSACYQSHSVTAMPLSAWEAQHMAQRLQQPCQLQSTVRTVEKFKLLIKCHAINARRETRMTDKLCGDWVLRECFRKRVNRKSWILELESDRPAFLHTRQLCETSILQRNHQEVLVCGRWEADQHTWWAWGVWCHPPRTLSRETHCSFPLLSSHLLVVHYGIYTLEEVEMHQVFYRPLAVWIIKFI